MLNEKSPLLEFLEVLIAIAIFAALFCVGAFGGVWLLRAAHVISQ